MVLSVSALVKQAVVPAGSRRGPFRGRKLVRLAPLGAVLPCLLMGWPAQAQTRPNGATSHTQQTAAVEPVRPAAPPTRPIAARPAGLVSAVSFGDIGYVNGFRFANLGGRRELFVPVPQNAEVSASELVLMLDDVSAHDARRNLEVLVNDRTVAAIVLDGKSQGRVVRIPLAGIKAKDGYLKLGFQYSGAATLDR